jgi:imidazolonepropionase-like amidohydrolase
MGVDPMDAIRAATYWPAVMMRAEKDSGTIAEGKFADIIAVRVAIYCGTWTCCPVSNPPDSAD